MTEPRRVLEPSATAAVRQHDWRGVGVDGTLGAARRTARDAVAAAHLGPKLPDPGAVVAWAAAELAGQAALDQALDTIYARLGVSRPPPTELPADLLQRHPALGGLVIRLLGAHDARTRYVFLEDLLAAL